MTTIYALVDSRTPSEFRYIGKTVKSLAHRLYHHRYRLASCLNLHKARWMQKVEREGATVNIVAIEECGDGIQCEREIYWIKKCRELGHEITNMSDGGEGGINPCPEVREKIAAKLRGRKRPAHVIEAVRRSGLRYKGSANPNFGKTHTPEAIARIIAGRVGVPLTESHKAKLSEFGGMTKLKPDSVVEIFKRARLSKECYKSIASAFDISTKAVSHIACGSRWKHLHLKERFGCL